MRTGPRKKATRKIFVLDTSVLLYDHAAFLNFKEHDVVIPVQVLEELDNFKSGNDTRNFEARSFIRLVDELSLKHPIHQWFQPEGCEGRLRIFLGEPKGPANAERIFASPKIDHKILNTALSLQEQHPEARVILVSKDICLRLKAKSLELKSEDYETGKIKNVQDLDSGMRVLSRVSEKTINQLRKSGELAIQQIPEHSLNGSRYYILESKKKSAIAYYDHDRQALFNLKQESVFGIEPLNNEQCMALHALMDPAIQLVSIQGNAGTGKTLLALAAALEQRKNFRQIFVTRPIIPLANKDIGFLPGDAKSKVDPYMAPIWDNLRFIREQWAQDEKMQHKLDELVAQEKIAVAPLAFMRGRTLTRIFFIVDEAQNLTPHEVKTIISRAGTNTKVVFTGDIYQIDTPYLDAESNGLSYLIDRAKGHPAYAHITLQQGVRSELANLANNLL